MITFFGVYISDSNAETDGECWKDSFYGDIVAGVAVIFKYDALGVSLTLVYLLDPPFKSWSRVLDTDRLGVGNSVSACFLNICVLVCSDVEWSCLRIERRVLRACFYGFKSLRLTSTTGCLGLGNDADFDAK